MENVLVKEISYARNGQAVICPVVLDLSYELLDPSNEEVLLDAAGCLADTFAGINIDGVRVSEPMTNACLLSREDMFEFVLSYLENVADQKLCYVARDKITGKVVGTLACEDFNPNEEVPVFTGNLEPMNTIISFLTELDEKFLNTIEQKTGKKATKHEYIHTFMAGVKMVSMKRFVIIKLFEMLIKDGQRRGYKGLFGEATNFKSIKMMTEYSGFHPVYDLSDKPICLIYKQHPTFKTIPLEVATDCRILYRPLAPEYDL